MPATAFKQVANNATSIAATDYSAIGVTSTTVNSGDGQKFALVPSYLTIWTGNDPGQDPNMEIVVVTARSGDVLTHAATTKTHTGIVNVGILDSAQLVTDMQGAINAAETTLDSKASITYVDGQNAAQNTVINSKVDKVAGKGLSTNDYSDADKARLANTTGTNTGDQDLSPYTTKTYVDGQNALNEKIANKVTSLTSPNNITYPTTQAVASAIAGVTPADATTTSKGVIQLAGDLAGTAVSPLVKNMQRVISARDYNAKGNGKIVTDGAMTAGSAVLSSSTANFTSAAVGMAAMVLGAGNDGNGGNVLTTTIQSYNPDGTVTLATAATNTVSGARVAFGTDDTTALQNACNAAAGLGYVSLDPLIYITPNKSFNVGLMSGLVGSGIDSTMIVGGGVNALKDVTVVRDLTLDSFNNYFYTGLFSRGITKCFERIKFRNWGRYGVDLANDSTRGQGSQDCYIQFCDFNHNGLNATNGGMVEVEGNYKNIHITDNTFGASTNGGCFMEVTVANGADDPGLHTTVNRELYVERNAVLGPFNKSGYVVGRHIRVRDNDFYTDFQMSSGGKEGPSPNSTWVSEDIEFTGNTINTNSSTGGESLIYFNTGQSAGDSGILQSVIAERNVFNNGNFILQLAVDSTLNDIRIRNNTFVDTRKNCIWFYANGFNLTLNNVAIEGNTFKNWSASAGTWSAIALTVSGASKTISLNRFRVTRNVFGNGRAAASKAIYVQSLSSGSVTGSLNYDFNDTGTATISSDVTNVLAPYTSDALTEGSTNQYYTPARAALKVSKAGDTIISANGSNINGLAITQNDTTNNLDALNVINNGSGAAIFGMSTVARSGGNGASHYGAAGYFQSSGSANGTTLNANRTVPATSGNGNPAGALDISSSAAETAVPLARIRLTNASSTVTALKIENAGTGAGIDFTGTKGINVANGTAASDVAAFGQIPVAGTGASNYAAGNDSRITGAEQTTNKSNDATFASPSATTYPSTQAVASYVSNLLTGALVLRGSTDASTNPNYPAAKKGDVYVVTVAGRIGGVAGAQVDVGDEYFAIADNAGGTQATVGTSWDIIEHNLVGALLSANNLSDVTNPATARANLGLSTAGGDLAGTYPNPTLAVIGTAGTTGSASSTSVVTRDNKGRITSASDTPILLTESQVTGLVPDLSARRTYLTPTAIKTANYTAAVGELVLVDASSGAVTITVPTAAAAQNIAVKKIDASANLVTIQASGADIIGSQSANSVPLRLQDETRTLLGSAGRWLFENGLNSLASLDGRYVQLTATPGGDLAGTNSTYATPVLTASGVAAGSYGSANAIPVITVDNKGRITLANVIAPASAPDATTASKGIVQLTGDLGGTATAPTTPTALHITGNETAAGNKTFSGIIGIGGAPTTGKQLRLLGTSDQGLIIESTGDHPRLDFKGSSGISSIFASNNGNTLDIVPVTSAGINSGNYFRVNPDSFTMDSGDANSTTTMKQLMNFRSGIKYWNGTASLYKQMTLQPYVTDAAGSYRLGVLIETVSSGTKEALSIYSNGNVGVGTGATAPNSTLTSAGSFATGQRTVTAATTLASTDGTVFSNSTNALTHTLPDATTCAGRIMIVTNINTGAVTVAPSGTQKINGATSYTGMATQYKYAHFQSDGANWFVVNNN